MKTLGAVLVTLCFVLLWITVVVGGVLESMDWTMRCPVCHLYIRKDFHDRIPFNCPRCGWVGGSSG